MASHPIRFGIQTGQQNISWDDMLSLWQKADGWGYDSLWNFDHFYPIFTDPTVRASKAGRRSRRWRRRRSARASARW
jgi:alkanesulfonate monooxygenase SsuD/methylene tetrahydromethanopterin reductase-like flavin-dependent oxidoreductase (luciferase family)